MPRFAQVLAALAAAALIWVAPADASLTWVRAWGSQGSGTTQLNAPQGIATDSGGGVWVADSNNNRIVHYTADGSFVNAFGTFGSAAGQFSGPHGVTLSPDGSSVYVADTGNGRVQQLDRSGTPIIAWSGDGTGPGPGAFSLPDGVVAAPDGSIYVSDGNNDRIQHFTASGGAISKFGGTGTGNGQLRSPFAVTTDAQGNVYVADTSNLRVVKFSPNGAFLQNFAPPETFGSPLGVAVDSAGNVYVADSSKHRIVEFDPAGKVILRLGSQGTQVGTQFGAPAGIAIQGNNLYVVENNNDRVQQFTITPDPVLGKQMVAGVRSGAVLVRAPGATRFVPLTADQSLPVGTVVDARKGRVRITASDGTKTFFADFYQGVFQIAQLAKKGATADIKLFGGSFTGCPKGVRAAANKTRSVRRLWGNGSGPFKTIGRFSSAAVRGTTWLTDDKCNGTLTRVTQGSVAVRDFVRRRTVVLKAPKRYFAAAKG